MFIRAPKISDVTAAFLSDNEELRTRLEKTQASLSFKTDKKRDAEWEEKARSFNAEAFSFNARLVAADGQSGRGFCYIADAWGMTDDFSKAVK